MFNEYFTDQISAIDAKFEAQKIAFAPIIFQVSKALLDFDILLTIDSKKSDGITVEEICKKLSLSSYVVTLVLELALSVGIIKIKDKTKPYTYILGKIGFFLLHDELSRVNINFIQDVCYQGLFKLQDSLKNGTPEGLKVFGEWETIYQGLSKLPPKAKKSWFEFDQYYSDCIFNDALPIIFKQPINTIMDIGCNTGKFAHLALSYNNTVKVTMVDLEGQINMAKENDILKPFHDRISFFPTNILQQDADLPQNVDAVWMSQFLDCFSLDEITTILSKIKKYLPKDCSVYILEPLWDKQRFLAAAFSVQATSVYFAAMANGNSKMYSYDDLCSAVTKAGYTLIDEHHDLGIHYYSLLQFRGL